ncbi:MAG TPA: hypothetical protein DEB05_11770 [Firmicutes bacterium]|nr:hypothetical protein [Bacillota bacterium]
MRILQEKRRAILIGLILLITGVPVYANNQFYAFSDLKPGMTGEGYTVFSGTRVEAFPVEVVGLLEGTGSVSHLILIKITGSKARGIAAGMSGSPIYINKKLVGAIGYGFQNADSRYAMVTPIEEMLTLWNETVRAEEKFSFQQGGLPGFKGVAFDSESPDDSWLWAQPVLTPLFISGLSPRARDYLTSTFQGTTFLPSTSDKSRIYPGLTQPWFPLASVSEGKKVSVAPGSLKPGSAITATLVEGDYQVVALGTLTWLDNNKFLGLGHPFLNKGQVEYGIGGASIVDIIDSNVFPFKLGIALPSFGRVLQDRGAGIAGELGILPRMVKVSTEVYDQSLFRTQKYEFTAVNDESLLPGLVLAGLMDAIDRALDRIGPGTATIQFQINGNNIPTVSRENLFYGRDIAAAALKEVGRVLQVIVENEFIQPQITEISTQIKVTPERLSAKLTTVELAKNEFAPGEKVTLMGKILPYRGSATEVPLEIEAPSTPGKWLLLVYGSDYGFTTEKNQEKIEEENFETDYYKSYSSLDEVLKPYLEKPQNNQLVAEVLPIEQGEEFGLEGEDGFEEEKVSGKERKYWTATTPYYLTGEEQILIEVIDMITERDDEGLEKKLVD